MIQRFPQGISNMPSGNAHHEDQNTLASEILTDLNHVLSPLCDSLSKELFAESSYIDSDRYFEEKGQAVASRFIAETGSEIELLSRLAIRLSPLTNSKIIVRAIADEIVACNLDDTTNRQIFFEDFAGFPYPTLKEQFVENVLVRIITELPLDKHTHPQDTQKAASDRAMTPAEFQALEDAAITLAAEQYQGLRAFVLLLLKNNHSGATHSPAIAVQSGESLRLTVEKELGLHRNLFSVITRDYFTPDETGEFLGMADVPVPKKTSIEELLCDPQPAVDEYALRQFLADPETESLAVAAFVLLHYRSLTVQQIESIVDGEYLNNPQSALETKALDQLSEFRLDLVCAQHALQNAKQDPTSRIGRLILQESLQELANTLEQKHGITFSRIETKE